jgi:hypothetical protein
MLASFNPRSGLQDMLQQPPDLDRQKIHDFLDVFSHENQKIENRQEPIGVPKRKRCATAPERSHIALSFLTVMSTQCQQLNKLTRPEEGMFRGPDQVVRLNPPVGKLAIIYIYTYMYGEIIIHS